MAGTGRHFVKTVCPICFEDLKPTSEGLLAVTNCGHVYHEHCLQQWFKYCKAQKKHSCPVCKQEFSSGNTTRLYFQSVGDQDEPSYPSLNNENNKDISLLSEPIRELKEQLFVLGSILDREAKDKEALKNALCSCKEMLTKETQMKNEVAEQKSAIQRLLDMKSQELDVLKLESLKMQDRNTSLAKELAAVKLVSDVEVGEDEILRLASFGNEMNGQETLEVLKKSLFIRNKNYKELMAKCNLLGRRESETYKKLERAKEKIFMLKAKLKKSLAIGGMTAEEASNLSHSLREVHFQDNSLNGDTVNSYSNNFEAKIAHSLVVDHTRENTDRENNYLFNPSIKGCKITMDNNSGGNCNNDARNFRSEDEAAGTTNDSPFEMVMNIKKEKNSSIIPKPGDSLLYSGLLCPDGAKRFSGKWSKRDHNTSFPAASSGSLIAIGSDGRGGRIKVLKPLNQPSLADNGSSVPTKRYKSGVVQGQGNLQIEHFFGRPG